MAPVCAVVMVTSMSGGGERGDDKRRGKKTRGTRSERVERGRGVWETVQTQQDPTIRDLERSRCWRCVEVVGTMKTRLRLAISNLGTSGCWGGPEIMSLEG